MTRTTLRRLEEHGLIDRTVYPAVPLHVEYSLTPLGREACEPLAHLRRWVVDNIERFPQAGQGAELSDPRASVVP